MTEDKKMLKQVDTIGRKLTYYFLNLPIGREILAHKNSLSNSIPSLPTTIKNRVFGRCLQVSIAFGPFGLKPPIFFKGKPMVSP